MQISHDLHVMHTLKYEIGVMIHVQGWANWTQPKKLT